MYLGSGRHLQVNFHARAGCLDLFGVYPRSRKLLVTTKTELNAIAAPANIGFRKPIAAIYDALVGSTALKHGRTRLTRDRRAQRTYDLLGVRYELVY